MAVQVSGMIGANSKHAYAFVTDHVLIEVVYQPSDSPRYFKANKGLLVICFWMCVSKEC